MAANWTNTETKRRRTIEEITNTDGVKEGIYTQKITKRRDVESQHEIMFFSSSSVLVLIDN